MLSAFFTRSVHFLIHARRGAVWTSSRSSLMMRCSSRSCGWNTQIDSTAVKSDRLVHRVSTLTAVLTQVSHDSKNVFGALNAHQLNWTDDPKRWSVAQCFDHLITTHSKYFPIFTRLASGDTRTTVWERHSPFSGFFGRLFISSLDPANVTRRSTTRNAMPSSSAIGADILDRFSAHQAEMIAHIRRFPPSLDPDVVITSPLLSVVTYRLDDVLVFLGLHCRRHFDQARRVTQSPGFPT